MRLIIIVLCVLVSFRLTADEHPTKEYALDNISQLVTPIAAPFLGLTGIKSKHTLKERIAVTFTSLVIDEGIVQTLKYTIHSTRPDGSDNKSFPSGHTSVSFAGAEIIREEYGWLYGGIAYAWSVGVGALRIHHHKHRLTDVIGGAAAGVISARLGYLLLPFERKLFRWDKNKTICAMPSMSKQGIMCSVEIFF